MGTPGFISELNPRIGPLDGRKIAGWTLGAEAMAHRVGVPGSATAWGETAEETLLWFDTLTTPCLFPWICITPVHLQRFVTCPCGEILWFQGAVRVGGGCLGPKEEA